MISKATIDKIFSAIRVEEIIGEYVQLKRAGSNYKGLSPFVDEKTPSFIVSPSKQIWKDFSSGKGGTAISFLMEIEGFTYPEALRYLAKKYGIEVEEDRKELSEEEKKSFNQRDLLYKIHEVANVFFQDQLWGTEEGKLIGLSYFKERELSTEIIKKFQLGYSPENKSAFTNFAKDKGYDKEILELSGFSIYNEHSDQGIDRFRERVMFPIHSFSGRVLGFGARILKSNIKAAKYLNSPENEIYHKSKVLYGLLQAKQAISREDQCLLVEGYMDVISLHQSGIENVVASSGTALTQDQIKLIKRLTQNVTILFDGDAAGIKASFRSIDMLLSEGMNVRIILFPEGQDPDSFAKKNSNEYVKEFIQNEAKDFVDFKAEILLQEVVNDPIKKSEAIRDIVKSVAFIPNSLKQEVYLKQIATKFGLTEQNLFNELQLQNQSITQVDRPKNKSNYEPEIKLSLVSESISPLLVLEEKLVELMLKYGDKELEKKVDDQVYKYTVVEQIIAHLDEDSCSVQNPINQKIIDEIKVGISENSVRTGSFFLNMMEDGVSEKVVDALLEPYQTSNWEKHNIYFRKEEEVVEKLVRDVIIRHKREHVVKLIEDFKKNLSDNEGNEEIYTKIMKLTELKNKIDQELFRIL